MAHDTIIAAISSLIAISPTVIVHGSGSMTVLQHTVTADRELMPEGYIDAYRCTFSGLYDECASVERDDTVTTGGKTYRVDQIVDDSFKVRRKLICSEA